MEKQNKVFCKDCKWYRWWNINDCKIIFYKDTAQYPNKRHTHYFSCSIKNNDNKCIDFLPKKVKTNGFLSMYKERENN